KIYPHANESNLISINLTVHQLYFMLLLAQTSSLFPYTTLFRSAIYPACPGILPRHETFSVFPETPTVHHARRRCPTDPARLGHGHRTLDRLGKPTPRLVRQ